MKWNGFDKCEPFGSNPVKDTYWVIEKKRDLKDNTDKELHDKLKDIENIPLMDLVYILAEIFKRNWHYEDGFIGDKNE